VRQPAQELVPAARWRRLVLVEDGEIGTAAPRGEPVRLRPYGPKSGPRMDDSRTRFRAQRHLVGLQERCRVDGDAVAARVPLALPVGADGVEPCHVRRYEAAPKQALDGADDAALVETRLVDIAPANCVL